MLSQDGIRRNHWYHAGESGPSHPAALAKGALMHYLRQCSDGRGIPLHPYAFRAIRGLGPAAPRTCRGYLFAAR